MKSLLKINRKKMKDKKKKILKIIVIVSLCLVCLVGAYLAGLFTNYSSDEEEATDQTDILTPVGVS